MPDDGWLLCLTALAAWPAILVRVYAVLSAWLLQLRRVRSGRQFIFTRQQLVDDLVNASFLIQRGSDQLALANTCSPSASLVAGLAG